MMPLTVTEAPDEAYTYEGDNGEDVTLLQPAGETAE